GGVVGAVGGEGFQGPGWSRSRSEKSSARTGDHVPGDGDRRGSTREVTAHAAPRPAAARADGEVSEGASRPGGDGTCGAAPSSSTRGWGGIGGGVPPRGGRDRRRRPPARGAGAGGGGGGGARPPPAGASCIRAGAGRP